MEYLTDIATRLIVKCEAFLNGMIPIVTNASTNAIVYEYNNKMTIFFVEGKELIDVENNTFEIISECITKLYDASQNFDYDNRASFMRYRCVVRSVLNELKCVV